MDSAEILKIALAALAGAVAKELVAWLVGLVKNARFAESFVAGVKAAFAPHNRAVMGDMFMVLFFVGFAIAKGWTDGPLAGKQVLVVVGSLLLALVSCVFLVVDLVKAVVINAATRRPIDSADADEPRIKP